MAWRLCCWQGSGQEPILGQPVAVYENAAWTLGPVHPPAAAANESRRTGRIVLTDLGVLALAEGDGRKAGAEALRYWIPYTQIGRAGLERLTEGVVCMLGLNDGRIYSVAIVKRFLGLAWTPEGEATRDFVERIDRESEARREQR